MSHALHTFTAAFASGETWALVTVAVVTLIGICGIAGYGVAAMEEHTCTKRREMRKSAHSWDRE